MSPLAPSRAAPPRPSPPRPALAPLAPAPLSTVGRPGGPLCAALCALLFALLVALLAGCAASGVGGGSGGGPIDGRAPIEGDCVTDADCGAYLCRAIDGRRTCVEPGYVPRTGDGTDCGECPLPGECRAGACIQPDPDGAICEFDDECGEDLCIAGRCTGDPTGDPCATSAECLGAFVCAGGACTPSDGGGGGCARDRECPGAHLCEAGRCIPDELCGITHPDVSGFWRVDSTLRFREALPGWVDGLLGAVAGPFHYLAGHTATLGLGLPGWVEAIVAPAIRSWAERNLPPWVIGLLGGIADLNDILSTWRVDETMELWPEGHPDVFHGTHVWNSVEMTYRGMPMRGRPEDIIDWRFTPSTFRATAVCGTLVIDRHDVDVSIGAIIAWIVDAVVYEASGRRYATLDAALAAASAGFCDGLAGAAASAVPDFPGARTAAHAACTSHLRGLSDALVRAVDEARLGLDLVTLAGHAPIVSERSLTPGLWEGTLAGSDFSGDFSASR